MFCIKNRPIGPNHPVFIIAEAGVNHNGDLEKAKKLVDIASSAGADAVKFQSFKAEKLVTPDASKAEYQLKNTDRSETQFEMLKKLELSEEAHRALQAYCGKVGITFLSTPFDESSADFLEKLGIEAYKIGSGEITNWPLLKHIAAKSKPIILSTGMSSLEEVRDAVSHIQDSGNSQLALLHCVSNYPANCEDVNLRAMLTMQREFSIPVGYSDHTLGVPISLAAVGMGACIVEKHFTLDKEMSGPDHIASADPNELRELVSGIRAIEQALGTGVKQPAKSEENTMMVARKSLVASLDIKVGETLKENMISVLRPGTGIPPSQLKKVLGKKMKRSLSAGELISWRDVA